MTLNKVSWLKVKRLSLADVWKFLVRVLCINVEQMSIDGLLSVAMYIQILIFHPACRKDIIVCTLCRNNLKLHILFSYNFSCYLVCALCRINLLLGNYNILFSYNFSCCQFTENSGQPWPEECNLCFSKSKGCVMIELKINTIHWLTSQGMYYLSTADS